MVEGQRSTCFETNTYRIRPKETKEKKGNFKRVIDFYIKQRKTI